MSQFKSLDLNRYKLLNNLKYNLDENNIFLHWLRYHKQDIVFIPKQIYISPDLSHFKRIKLIYNLNNYYSLTQPALFFGVYNENDLNIIKNHQGDRYLIWGGTDCDIRFQNHRELVTQIKNIYITKHYAISVNIMERLNKIGIPCEKIELNLTHTEYFKPLKVKGDSIYIYNGYEKGNEHIYGEEEYSYITKKFNKFMYIFSHGLKLPYTKMANLYEKCFIGLRLTKNDGSANTVTEMQKMGLNVVHNGEFNNTLSWKNTQDIITHIHNEYFKKEKVTFKKLEFNDKIFNSVKKDVHIIDKYIQQYKTILFICSDYPGYGGAATNCYDLIKYYKQQHINVKGIFWTWNKNDLNSINTNNYDKDIINNLIFTTKTKLKTVLKNLNFKPDLVILRNLSYLNLKLYFDCPIFLLLPGLFTDKLNKNYKTLKSKTAIVKNINKQLLKTVGLVDMVFSNNYDTTILLKEYFDINSILFYFNLIPYLDSERLEDKNFDKRNYDYGIIVSNFERTIKNIPNTIKDLDGKIILIGKNSNIIKENFKDKNIVSLPLLSHTELLQKLKEIKTVVLKSHYEGCANILLEAYFNGCMINT